VTVTKITNVYVNRNTTVNHITYVNERVNNGVTVVSHDAFVNARPVAQNIMRVDQKEIAAAPVGHVVAAEPIRTSVMGVGRLASVRPPASVISRQVVAVRTPAAPPHSLEQREAQANGRLNQQGLVRPAGQPASVNASGRPAPTQDGFRPFTQTTAGNNGGGSEVRQMPNTQPRVYKQQGTPQPENSQPKNDQTNESRNAPPANQPAAATHPLVRPAPPVQQRSPQQEQQQEQKFNQWHQQRPASPPPEQRAPSRAPEPRPQAPSKQGR
jgi:hypothetical protein